MSIKPKPPTGRNMLLSTSVIRKKRPDLRKVFNVRISTKTLRNSLRVIGLRLFFAGGRARQDSRFYVILAPAFLCVPSNLLPPTPQMLAPTGSSKQMFSLPLLPSMLQGWRGLPSSSSHIQLQQKSSIQTRKAQNLWQQFERERIFAKGAEFSFHARPRSNKTSGS
jgi:hypothetical protein